MKMQKQFPNEYKFFPKTFLLPTDFNDLKLALNFVPKPVFIIKPENSCQGRGIFLCNNINDLKQN